MSLASTVTQAMGAAAGADRHGGERSLAPVPAVAPGRHAAAQADTPALDAERMARRRRRLVQELLVRAAIAVLIFGFNETYGLVAGEGVHPLIRGATLVALLLNVPYYLLGRTGRWPRAQAHARILIDVAFVTVGLYGAGGLAAASKLSVYLLVPVYAGIVYSGASCLIATLFATVAYVVVISLQQSGWLPMERVPPPGAWGTAAFNLFMLNVVGGLTAFLAEVYRRSRHRVQALHQEVERTNRALLTLNQEIQRASRLQVLGEVVAGIAHEIRNVQQVAGGYVELARRQVADAVPQALPFLDRVEESCDTTMRIVRNALDMARQPAAERTPVALAEAAAHVAELKRYDLKRDRIGVELAFPADLPRVLAVPVQLQQVLLNLVTNAHDALREHPGRRVVRISGRCEGSWVCVDVRDSGPGIPPDALVKILEPFYTTKPTGTGLGLAISAGITRDCGGTLTADNAPEGGAVFQLRLPAASADEGGTPAAGRAHATRNGHGGHAGANGHHGAATR
jgi:signal transduction histidine kinase